MKKKLSSVRFRSFPESLINNKTPAKSHKNACHIGVKRVSNSDRRYFSPSTFPAFHSRSFTSGGISCSGARKQKEIFLHNLGNEKRIFQRRSHRPAPSRVTVRGKVARHLIKTFRPIMRDVSFYNLLP